ncbi:MAG TPA: bifunctional 5,10-methylenetetrahydrofolate dehydrogenase/5,10-methenyltetrahydrofolate cyclohydrolase [Atopostipes sp.]|nr:bifunctional 5,10-methylenetetrahydrofolate dehydrogenase/5,10-methenyltetrahydrofolate cyclohydrolase [Atopostipes sp.]
MTRILNGKEVGQALREHARMETEKLRAEGIIPKLAILRVGDDEASMSYERSAKKAMKDSSIEAETFQLEETATTEEILETIEQLNTNQSIHGIIIMQPLPKGHSRYDISSHIDPNKDVDGIHPMNLGYLIEGNKKALVPSTPQAVLEILDYYNYNIEGADIVVIGSSAVVGKPLSIMLSNRNATVSNLHIYTKDIKQYTKQADILISATGALGLIDVSHVKENAVVIDVGYGYKDGKITGDVQFEKVRPYVSAISPVPGGVGAVTTSVLAAQVIKAVKLQTKKQT